MKKRQISKVQITMLILLVLIGILPFLPQPSETNEGMLPALGRLHPLIVHFPVALLLLVLVLELWAMAKPGRDLGNAIRVIGIFAGVSTVAAIFAGYFLYQSGEYRGTLVRNHLWGGVGLGLLFLLGAWAYSNARRKIYLSSLVIGNLLLVYTGHKGGQLTHGTDYLTEMLPSLQRGQSAVDQKPMEELLVYEDLLQPLFKKHCNSCHNPRKAKGGLVLSSLDELNRGGKSKKEMLVPGSATDSELFARVSLEPDHEDYMPPDGKPPLPPEAVQLMQWWIDEGGSPGLMLGTGLDNPEFAADIHGFLPQIAKIQRKQVKDRRERDELAAKLVPLAEKIGLVAAPDPDTDSLYFGLSMELPPRKVDNTALLKLEPYYHAISKISLIGSEINDDALHTLSLMPNLRQIYLNKTCITGEGLAFLSQLDRLELLNFSHSDLDDKGLLHLMEFEALKKVYLFRTFVHEDVLQALQWHLKDVELLVEEGPYY